MADQWQDNAILNAQIRDDDDDIPDEWDVEPEEKPKKAPVEEKPKPAPPTTKNKLAKKKFLGDGRNSDEELLESLKEPDRHYTPEELEEFSRRADLRKEELKLNMASDFVGTSGERHSLDNLNLVTKEEFLDYSFRLYNRLELLSKSEFYPDFLDHLLNGLTKSMSLDGVKRISTTLQAILVRKQNDERDRKSKTKAKKPVKPQLKADRNPEYDSFVGEGITTAAADPEYDEDNDFM
ncbi:unnamed protein product [Adineta steineri]|uniref:Eukaryotic translation initiation factor 3 30 kDa subunit n=1 Tax=Adineta steineri TaxID=433720 RepID=A0A819E5M9_9BILA|nr:unnamed protein product [Adineta steineri]CAF3844651.1 unnamed protein product [Adineta steineri]